MPTAAADALMRLGALTRDRDPALSAWASQAGRRLASGLDPARAIGMDKQTRFRLRMAERNRILVEAYNLLEVEGGPWTRALALEAHCRKFESDIWPSWRTQGKPPPEASRLRTLLWAARRLGKLPAEKRLSEICRQC